MDAGVSDTKDIMEARGPDLGITFLARVKKMGERRTDLGRSLS